MKDKDTKRLLAKGSAAVEILRELYPDAECSLESGGDPWRLLVMARLSAQCTDERVNIVCRDLFREIPDAQAMADAPLAEIEELIRPCGLFRTKAKSLKESAAMLLTTYEGRVPDTMEELLSLPGVGRKIANLLLGDIYKKGGIVADTHCIRICGRIGFYPEELKDPLRVERILTPVIPISEQSDFCHRIVHFGREICTARSPKCGDCPMREICDHNK
ncbi:MAG: endonuclease III [Clostridia bacterium]|nr:endonuclease III [Clostridia bacterium]MBQ5887502.1 endonuclease III [Clostridia bacterium]